MEWLCMWKTVESIFGSASIRPTIAPNSRRVRWLSVNSSQYYRAWFTSRPPVFTKHCCKLVSDQFPILFGNANLT